MPASTSKQCSSTIKTAAAKLSPHRPTSSLKTQALQAHSPVLAAPVHRTLKKLELTVLPRLAACVEMEDAASRFENVAGRSAMIGFTTAFLVEVIADQGLFDNLATAGLPGIAGFLACGAALGAVLACGSRETLGATIQEAVMCSLTARARSAGSLSGAQLDDAVDFFFDRLPIFDVALSNCSYDDGGCSVDEI